MFNIATNTIQLSVALYVGSLAKRRIQSRNRRSVEFSQHMARIFIVFRHQYCHYNQYRHGLHQTGKKIVVETVSGIGEERSIMTSAEHIVPSEYKN